MALAGAGVVEGAVVTTGASGAVMGVSNQLVLGRPQFKIKLSFLR
jgi:hypothetical protein